MENVLHIFCVFNKELCGLIAGNWYSDVLIGCMLSEPTRNVSPRFLDSFIIYLAKPYQLVLPEDER
jgi:hypothetical protein